MHETVGPRSCVRIAMEEHERLDRDGFALLAQLSVGEPTGVRVCGREGGAPVFAPEGDAGCIEDRLLQGDGAPARHGTG